MSISENAYKALIDANFDYREEITALRAENKQLQNLLRDANKGAELNSKVNWLVTDKCAALRARVAELTEGLERLCDWCTRYDILRDEVVRARMTLAGKSDE